jgi:rSAM/selenodomain-associated transferase 1
MRRTIVVMAKAPIPGRVKTRLCPPLDLRTAARLHESFVLDVLEKAAAIPDTELVISYAPRGGLAYFRDAAPGARAYLLQEGRTLGGRMSRCFETLCEPGRAVALIGTDVPTLPARCLELAFDALASSLVDVVFGPASDGGYYSVAMTSVHPGLFQGISWTTPEVLAQSIEKAAELDLGWYLLPEWYDVDRPADLAYLKSELLDHWAARSSVRHTRDVLRSLVNAGML